MSVRTAAQALGDATSALVTDHDTIDILVRLVGDCADVLSADAVGLVVDSGEGQLELLASTSHRVAELEVFQIQQVEGSCVDSVHGGVVLSVAGIDELVDRWPSVGKAMLEAGFAMAHAQPLTWRDQVVGAMNVFRSAATPLNAEECALSRAFADVATLVIVQSPDVSLTEIHASVRRALRGRVIVEEAKGVLAHTERMDMSRAYDVIMERAAEQKITLTAMAARVVAEAQRAE